MPSPPELSISLGADAGPARISARAVPKALVVPLQELLAGRHLELPILPPTVARLILACTGKSPNLEEITGLVAQDPSLTAHVLSLANSAGFAPMCAIETIPDAVRRLGNRAINDLAVSNMVSSFAMSHDHRRTSELFQRASIAGVYSYCIGRVLGPIRRATLLPGLLHDIGRPICIAFLTDLRGIVPDGLNKQVIEYLAEQLHVEVGIHLVREWNLPASLEVAIRYHADTSSAPDTVGDLRDAHIANLADVLAGWTLEPESTSELVLSDHPDVLALGLTPSHLTEILACLAEARDAGMGFG